MKSFIAAFTALFCASLLSVTPVLAEEVIKLRCDIWKPYSDDPKAERPGAFIEIARAVFAKKGVKIDYQLMPWSRAVSEVSAGTVDVAAGAAKEDIPDAIFPEEPLAVFVSSFLVKKGKTFAYEGRKTLDAMKIGGSLDYAFGSDGHGTILADYLKERAGKNVTPVSGDDPLSTGIEMVRKGRIDGYLDDGNVFRYFIARELPDGGQFEIVPNVGVGQPMYLAFSPKNPKSKEYAKMVDDGIRELRASGELKKILDRYGVEDWKK